MHVIIISRGNFDGSLRRRHVGVTQVAIAAYVQPTNCSLFLSHVVLRSSYVRLTGAYVDHPDVYNSEELRREHYVECTSQVTVRLRQNYCSVRMQSTWGGVYSFSPPRRLHFVGLREKGIEDSSQRTVRRVQFVHYSSQTVTLMFSTQSVNYTYVQWYGTPTFLLKYIYVVFVVHLRTILSTPTCHVQYTYVPTTVYLRTQSYHSTCTN